MNKNTLNTLKQLKVMNLRIVSFEQHEFQGLMGGLKTLISSTIKIMCEMGCYANHRLEAWVAVLLESLLTMCSMSNGCSCKHELVAGRKTTRVKLSQKCNLSTLIIKNYAYEWKLNSCSNSRHDPLRHHNCMFRSGGFYLLRSAHFMTFGPSYAELQRPFLFL